MHEIHQRVCSFTSALSVSLLKAKRRPINRDAVQALHQVAELFPVGLHGWLVRATQTLPSTGQLLGYRRVNLPALLINRSQKC